MTRASGRGSVFRSEVTDAQFTLDLEEADGGVSSADLSNREKKNTKQQGGASGEKYKPRRTAFLEEASESNTP